MNLLGVIMLLIFLCVGYAMIGKTAMDSLSDDIKRFFKAMFVVSWFATGVYLLFKP